MKIVVFGLTISSSWGNGHATLWRGLAGALHRRGWRIVFFERDTSYYALNRDLHEIAGGELVLYRNWTDVAPRAAREARDADAVMVTSFCPDGIAAADLCAETPSALRIFYDLDTPVTLANLGRGERPCYIGPRLLADFHLVLSYTGGEALSGLQELLSARRAVPLYGHVDPHVHRPVQPQAAFAGDLSYLGTYAADRQDGVQRFFIGPAGLRPNARFVLGGAQYPPEFPWVDNVFFVRHLPPADHASFFCSSPLTLNVTRRAMAEMGWCPSGRLFEAAACGTALISDDWEGLDTFFEPGRELLVARTAQDVLTALDRSPEDTRLMGARARERVLAEHTCDHRAAQLEALLAATPRAARVAKEA
ncbi:CgeB family protein [Chelatococcus reniformis]|uniref:Glycosyl transferase n=1 Tax=Chelatococcus reniformis TaxID=1494448 RepID=A0A916UM09_9HYPH|nr:glycosyltransferase [Chelatococcus reniformis]GGC78484.1 glycosyl transferase [Chelatococcus reniformis]